jgi:hypothetical protein
LLPGPAVAVNHGPAKAVSAPKKKPERTDALGDPLPPGALLRIGTTRLRHQGVVSGVTFSPDG